MGIGDIFNVLLINPTFNILLVFIFLLTSWGIPGSLGWAIIALTSLFRTAFNPMYKKQAEMAAHMEELRPKIEELQKKYKDKPQKLQEAQMKLYKDRGINPASGCLIALIQLPVILALYRVLLHFFELKGAELTTFLDSIAYVDFLKGLTIDPWFLGFNLAATPSQYQEFGVYYLALPLLTAVLQYFQITMTQPKPVEKTAEQKAADKKAGKDESFQAVFQKQMKIMFPIMIAYFSYILPVGLALYWNVFSLISILQVKNKK